MFLSPASPGFCLVLDSRGRLGGKVGRACEEFEKMRLVFLRVKSCGAGFLGCPT